MTPHDVVRKAIPDASDSLCEYIVWGRTPFPFIGPPEIVKLIYRAARRYLRAEANNIVLCELCSNKAFDGEDLCFNCDQVLFWARFEK